MSSTTGTKESWSGKICSLNEQFPFCDACSLRQLHGQVGWAQDSFTRLIRHIHKRRTRKETVGPSACKRGL